MPGIHHTEEMEIETGKKKRLSETPTPKKMKRKIQNGEAEELCFEQVSKFNGQVNGDSNNDQKIPKLKKKKKPVEKQSSSEADEQCNEEQEESEAPKLKKVKKKKQKVQEESVIQTDVAEAEPQVNGKKSGKKTQGKKTSVNNTEETDAPPKKKKKMEIATETNEVTPETVTEDEEITLEKIQGDFSKFPIGKDTVANLKAKGVTYLFPIQFKTFDTVYSGKDVVVQARTGTGKTFSFAIPLIEKLNEDKIPLAHGRAPKVLILTPTRELAIQIKNEICSLSKRLKTYVFYGGTPYQPQLSAVNQGIDILVGTPGRIRDHIENHRLDLTTLKHVVLDEVDMMFDMGFAEQVENILSVRYKADPEENPQTLLFSATCPDWMYNIAKKYMKTNYEKIDLVGHRSQKAAVTVEHLAIECNRFQKAVVLGDVIQVYSGNHGKTIVFCDSKLEAHELSTNNAIKQSAKALHGDLQQKEREVILKGFRNGSFGVLIATNVAARGLDIPEVDLVVLFSAPREADAYIHRSGRTGRAGRTGVCISLYEPRDRYYLQNVERSTGITFKRVGIPTTLNVAKSSSADAIKSLDSIPVDVLEHFKVYAEELIEKKGAVEALAAALAHISGASSLKQRSLLNMDPGYVTIILRSSITIHSLSYVWRTIKEQMGEEFDSQVHRMCLLKDSKGVCFDVALETLKNLQTTWDNSRRFQLSVATELPELQESRRDADNSRGRGFGGRGRGGRSFDRRNRNSSQRGGNRRGGPRRGR
ncbi:nucleolar RNA helicase 2 [Pseudophryne corroboree]|uniref:nucleolar RNA helicase 2 n=1 Tax=Pseudophryne corroboree TaxID=495146 RepID=UPI003081D691